MNGRDSFYMMSLFFIVSDNVYKQNERGVAFMLSIFKKLEWFFKQYWKRYLIAITMLLIVNVLEIIPPRLIGYTIDLIDASSLTNERLFQIIGLFALIIIITYVMSFGWRYNLFGGSQILESLLRRKLMAKFLKMSPSFYERNRTGDLMARATNDLSAIRMTAGFGVLTLVDSVTYLGIIVMAMAFTISWKLTLFALLPLPLLAYLGQILGKKIHAKYMISQKSFGDMNDSVLELIEGVRVTRAFVQEERVNDRFESMTNDVVNKFMAVEKLDAWFIPMTIIIMAISFIISLGYGAVLVNSGEMTIGEIVTFNVYLNMLIWPMFAIGMLFNVMQRGNASLDRVEETLNAEEVIDDPLEQVVPDDTNVEFNAVTFKYPSSDRNNLEDISIRLHRGETLGIVGKTGSGKTTLIKQILKEYPTGEGIIQIGGYQLDQLTKVELRNLIGYVPQEHILFSRTIKENILFGKEDATDEEIDEAIQLAHFTQDIENLPNGLETLVGEKGIAISGGQKQRISIARAMIKNPEILILDDSLSAVDAKTEHAIIRNIQTERQGKTTIISAHRLSAVRHADIIVVLEEGRIIQKGTHAELSQLKGWYYDQLQLQDLNGGEMS